MSLQDAELLQELKEHIDKLNRLLARAYEVNIDVEFDIDRTVASFTKPNISLKTVTLSAKKVLI